MAIKLTFVNESNDDDKVFIVLCLKLPAASSHDLVLASKIIESGARGSRDSFEISESYQLGATDEAGNPLGSINVPPGSCVELVETSSGSQLTVAGPGTDPVGIELSNTLPRGAMNATAHRNGLLIDHKTSIAPGSKAVFQFAPHLWIGAFSSPPAGQEINPSLLNTSLPLFGIARAEVVMTGGCSGPGAQPFAFHLRHIVMA